MAPRTIRQRVSSTGPSESQIRAWLHDETAVARFNSMKNSKFFEGAFMKFPEFNEYAIRELAEENGFDSLIGYEANNVKIFPLLIKLFYANMNLDHQDPRNKIDCIWTLVCGVKIYLPLQRLRHILRCSSEGLDIDLVHVDMSERDEISHRFLSDDLTELKSSALRPRARIIHRALIRSLQPRTGSYEKVYRHDFQALYALYSNQHVNWAKIILDEFQNVSIRQKYKTIHYGAYIMRILQNFGVIVPESDFTTVGELSSKTLSLMGLPKRLSTQPIISFQEWSNNRDQGVPQPYDTNIASSSQEPPQETKDDDDDDDEIHELPMNATPQQALFTIAQNQVKLNKRLIKMEKNTNKKFNSIKGVLNKIWEKVSCSSSTSTGVVEKPAPFTWSSSEEEVEEENQEHDDEIGDDW